jgi:hypothetical protein
LQGLPGALEEYAAASGRPLALRPDPALPPGAEVVEAAGHGG